MTDRTPNLTRRRVLQSVAGGAAGTSIVGLGAAQQPDRHIVGTASKRGQSEARRQAEAVHRELDFGAIGQAVAGRFSEKARENLARRKDVRYIEPDGAVEALSQDLPWGVDRVDADVAQADGETGAGADIAIIDTGIDSDHPDLRANLGTGYAVETCSGSDCRYDWDDDKDHGTHCAGIAGAVDDTEGVVGVAPDATLHAVKVLDDTGSGNFSGVAEGVEWVADQGYDVGSMSLGATSGSQTIRDACQYAYEKGVLLVAAAGNDGACTDCVRYPAVYPTVVAVSSTNLDDELSSFSSTGPEVELAAPGTYIYSTVRGGYATYSGTSMACPHVAAAAGTLMSNGYTNAEARDRLTSTAEDLGLSSTDQGSGLLNVDAALGDSEGGSSLAVATDSATGVGETGATLNGTLADVTGFDSADVYFEWGEVGSLSNATSPATRSSTGSFDETIGSLEDGVEYEFRAVAVASDGIEDAGDTVSFVTSDDPPAVTTGSPSSVTETSATLEGSLDDLGNAATVDVHFEWGEPDSGLPNATSVETLSATGSFSRELSALSAGTDYEYRAVASASDGDTGTGGPVTFGTAATETNVAVDTESASSVGESSATLHGSLSDLGGADAADVHFEWGERGSGLPNATSVQTLSSTGPFDAAISGLAAGTDYEYRAVAEAADGDADIGSTRSFTTDSASTAPTVDSYRVTEAGSPNPHAEITAEWTVSDANGDLDAVLVEVLDSGGRVVDSARTSVDGRGASGRDEFKRKHANDRTFDVRLTVADAAGNVSRETRTVSS